MPRPVILFVFGTRPEAIKLAPVIEELRRDPESFDVKICVTGQHREMLDQVLELFSITPDFDLDLMQPDQDLIEVTAAALLRVRDVIRACAPRVVVVQGYTTSAMAAGLVALYAGVDVAHVEAGLRSGDLGAPWPEEANRRLLSVVTRIHFAPTEEAKANLESEGATNVIVTGNTVIDALLRVRTEHIRFPFLDDARRLVLVTGHRRESFGAGLESICHALADLVRAFDDIEIVFPVHLNPNVRQTVHTILGAHDRVHLIEPIDYPSFVALMRRATLILSDSGGVQEEAPSLGKAVLVMRETTERPEAVRAGNVRLVGTDRARIVAEAGALLRDRESLDAMATVRHVFGDGRASQRIADALRAQCYPPAHVR
jgi:UDP-N-acetylglucosamine 2-epimerase (non-hydrolysing)